MAETGSPVAVVSGGAQGLGAAIVGVLLKKGYKVCVSDIQAQKGQLFVEELQEIYGTDNVIFVACDVSNEKEYEKVFETAMEVFGKLDLVVNNAGILMEQNPRKTVDINLIGPITGCQLAFKHMGKSNGRNGGMVINTASILGFLPAYAFPIYTATKHGVIGLTRSYGLPYYEEKEGIIFTAICPSYTDTKLLKSSEICSAVPGYKPYETQELMTPQYVAGGILKLLDERINGSTLLVTKSGGYQYIRFQKEFDHIPLK